METRVLTLFDDEEFFPKEQPKETPKKEKTPKAATTTSEEENPSEKKDPASESIAADTEKGLPETEMVLPENIPSDQTEAANDIENIAAEDVDMASAITEDVIPKPLPIEKETISFGIHKELPAVNIEMEPEIIISEKPADHIEQENGVTPENIMEAHEPEDANDIAPDEASITDAETEADIETSIEATADLIEEAASIEHHTTESVSVPENGINETEFSPIIVNKKDEVEEETEAPLETSLDVDEEIEAPEIEVVPTPTASDKELSKQILSELIQLDYTALIQKDYSFDLSKSTVVTKKASPKREPVPEEPNTVEEEEEEEIFEDVTPLPEWDLDKKYYTIGEVAQLFEVNTSHIRFWTNEFKLKPRTTRKGDRLYSPKDIAELRLIHHLVKVKKHTIKGAREKLKAEKSGVNNKLDLKESLVQLKDTLLKIREQL
jgi:DNA-binding transcriptional MerR regulator